MFIFEGLYSLSFSLLHDRIVSLSSLPSTLKTFTDTSGKGHLMMVGDGCLVANLISYIESNAMQLESYLIHIFYLVFICKWDAFASVKMISMSQLSSDIWGWSSKELPPGLRRHWLLHHQPPHLRCPLLSGTNKRNLFVKREYLNFLSFQNEMF